MPRTSMAMARVTKPWVGLRRGQLRAKKPRKMESSETKRNTIGSQYYRQLWLARWNILLVMAVKTCPTASKKKNLEATEVLTSMTTLAVMIARKPMIFKTRMPLRMM